MVTVDTLICRVDRALRSRISGMMSPLRNNHIIPAVMGSLSVIA